MGFQQIAVPLLALALAAAAAGQTPGTTGTAGTGAASEITAHQILSGNERGVAHAAHRIIRSQQQLQTLLQQIYSGQVPPSAPPIDFSQQVLVYYALGTASHGAEKVYVRSGRLERGILYLQVEIAEPAGTCLGTNSLTAPFALAALPFPARDVQGAEFDVAHKRYPCK